MGRKMSTRTGVSGIKLILVVALVLSFLKNELFIVGVDKNKFRTCAQTGFCNRHRSEEISDKKYVVPGSVVISNDNKNVRADLTYSASTDKPLQLEITFLESGSIRVRATEKLSESFPPRWEAPDILIEGGGKAAVFAVEKQTAAELVLSRTTRDGVKVKAVVNMNPFAVDVNVGDSQKPAVSINRDGTMYFEQRQEKKSIEEEKKEHHKPDGSNGEADDREIVDWGEDGKPIYADAEDYTDEEEENADTENSDASGTEAIKDDIHGPETFGGHTDSRPYGATSIGVDIFFPESKHVFGIPEHATTFALKDTVAASSNGGYDEPYRLYNLDVFEYEMDVPMALYGHIPVMTSHTKEQTVSVFWNNPSETFVDVTTVPNGKSSKWMSESGVFDLFVFPGPSPVSCMAQYAEVTGTTPIPPMFAISYHQCRWNYNNEADVHEVNSMFEKYDFPYDVIWLDIEHTDGKRYFTWDKVKFPNPEKMQAEIKHFGRKMVNIVDPHIKRDARYPLHKEAEKNGYYIKTKDGKDFDGWCWPGSSSYLDFTSPKVRDFWADRFSFANYPGSTDILHIWNDMNEPSVFNGPEVTISKDTKNLEGVEFREFHNLYGFYHQWATMEGITRRDNKRAFVLSRAFFAGSQRFGAIWTGDNAAEWSHLAASIPMLLTIGLTGLPFAGADVGGFFGNPDAELLTRWYQAGAYQPFFRAHAHIDTKRREPWLFGDETLRLLRDIVRQRYTWLPYIYGLYKEAEDKGVPVMRPLWMHFPQDEKAFANEDSWLLGADLLVAPILVKGEEQRTVYFPGAEGKDRWFDVISNDAYDGGNEISVAASIAKVPVFQRGGSILSRKMRARRSSHMMKADPYTVTVALDPVGSAVGTLYIDDESSFDYKTKQQFCVIKFTYARASLSGQTSCSGGFHPDNTIERIVIVGEARAINAIITDNGKELLFTQNEGVTSIRKPDLSVSNSFSIQLKF